MAFRWIGLAHARRLKTLSRKAIATRAWSECMHGLAGAGMLVLAAGMNFAMHPDALAAVVAGERPIIGFVPDEPAFGTSAVIPVDEADVRLLAATTWAEARSEGELGMRAVAHVIVNRMGDRFGGDIETVVLAPRQFSAWNLNDPNRPLALDPDAHATGGGDLETWQMAQRVAREVLSGQSVDPTRGALFYHTRAVRPYWARYGEGRRVIGAHVFYNDVARARARRPLAIEAPEITAPEPELVTPIVAATATAPAPTSADPLAIAAAQPTLLTASP